MNLPTEKSVKTTDILQSNILIYGLPKIGKTTFAATVNGGNGVLFAATEKGQNHVSVFKVDIHSWEDFLRLGLELRNAKDHGFKLLVIDIVDHLYKHCERYICAKLGIDHPADAEYGKGFSLVKEEFGRVLNNFNALGLGLMFLSHATQREFKTETASFDRMDTTLSGAPSNLVSGMCDYIWYLFLDEKTDQRMIRTGGSKYFNAGCRASKEVDGKLVQKLPFVMPLDYAEIVKALK